MGESLGFSGAGSFLRGSNAEGGDVFKVKSYSAKWAATAICYEMKVTYDASSISPAA
jgi:hypothetical protein